MHRLFKLFVPVTLALLTTLQAGALESSVTISRFIAQEKPYAEFFFYILGSSVVSDSTGHASIQCTYFIYRDSTVVAGDKYNLVTEMGSQRQDFMDLKRHYLKPGKHRLTVEFVDNQDTTNNLS
ncbi:MAG: hypothetical protein R3330_16465, partial [Saprospiraceae bacterium]|nr:hypothetical protein [Saprospiraceae bacterium]